MSTIKLVIVGASGVGKTSFRVKYISGRFSTGYRPTIGVDFITKTVPNPVYTGEGLTLQIWDTAGQERFSSLSTAFFRGADAAILMYDVNNPDSLYALKKWWKDFCAHAPVREEEMQDFCCVVVGNKVDLMGEEEDGDFSDEDLGEGSSTDRRVSKEEAMRFLRELVPLDDEEGVDTDSEADVELSSSQYTLKPDQPIQQSNSKRAMKRLLNFPNGLLTRVGLMSSTTTPIVPQSTSDPTTPTTGTVIPPTPQSISDTQNNTQPHSESPHPQPSPSQRLLKGISTPHRSITRPVASRVRSHPHSLSHSFKSGTLTSTTSGFSAYHTPAASVGSFTDTEAEWYDAHTEVSIFSDGDPIGGRDSRSGSLFGSRNTSRQGSRTRVLEPRRRSSLATLTNLNVHGVLGASTTSLFSSPVPSTKPSLDLSSPRHPTPLAITTIASDSSGSSNTTTRTDSSANTTSTTSTSVDGDAGNETSSESSGSAVTITPARIFASSASVSTTSTFSSNSTSAARVPPTSHPLLNPKKSASVSLTSHSATYSASSSSTPKPKTNTNMNGNPPSSSSSTAQPSNPEKGPALFFASAKTGFNVESVFEHIAKKVVVRWDKQAVLEANGAMGMNEDTVLGTMRGRGRRVASAGAGAGGSGSGGDSGGDSGGGGGGVGGYRVVSAGSGGATGTGGAVRRGNGGVIGRGRSGTVVLTGGGSGEVVSGTDGCAGRCSS